jgi:hypothetical protein
MPIVPQLACMHPPDDTVICPFMEFRKFRDLFATEELYRDEPSLQRRQLSQPRTPG